MDEAHYDLSSESSGTILRQEGTRTEPENTQDIGELTDM